MTSERARVEEPSENRKSAPPKEPRRDPVWDALVEACGPVETRVERTRRGKVARELREAVAAPHSDQEASALLAEQVRRRAAALREAWGFGNVTDTALAAHWAHAGTLLRGEQPRNDRLGGDDVL